MEQKERAEETRAKHKQGPISATFTENVGKYMDEPLKNASGSGITPSALLQLFNNALAPTPIKQMLLLKGVYKPGKGANYNGYFYDSLKDETTEATLTLIVPALLRGKLVADKTIEFHAFLTKRVVPVGGRIELHVNIT